MKALYNSTGKVVAVISGPSAFEGSFRKEGLQSVVIPDSIGNRLLNRSDPLTISECQIVDGKIVIP